MAYRAYTLPFSISGRWSTRQVPHVIAAVEPAIIQAGLALQLVDASTMQEPYWWVLVVVCGDHGAPLAPGDACIECQMDLPPYPLDRVLFRSWCSKSHVRTASTWLESDPPDPASPPPVKGPHGPCTR